MAEASHQNPAPAGPDAFSLVTSILANLGLAGLILLNLWVQSRRRKK
jgi:hypothetical protein